jgi:predicted nucleic acid-binding protein
MPASSSCPRSSWARSRTGSATALAPRPTRDAGIAARATESGAVLVTDDAHSAVVDGLALRLLRTETPR